MNYRLAVLTHGHNAALVWDALGAWKEYVAPQPAEVLIWFDGDYAQAAMEAWDAIRYSPWNCAHDGTEDQRGFCSASASLWRAASSARGDISHVAWLEHDFRVSRPVDLRELAAVLDATPNLAQMALMRDAYSAEEKAAGGLFEYRRADFVAQPPQAWAPCDWMAMPWFTTNPCLMRRDFMVAHPFIADGLEHCEGRFGVALASQGWSFGTWGDGSVYVRHVGHRTGFGY